MAQEKQEGKLKKLLREAKKTIAYLKAKIESLVAELAATKDELHNISPSVVSFVQRIWSRRMIGFVKGFAPMRCDFTEQSVVIFFSICEAKDLISRRCLLKAVSNILWQLL